MPSLVMLAGANRPKTDLFSTDDPLERVQMLIFSKVVTDKSLSIEFSQDTHL